MSSVFSLQIALPGSCFIMSFLHHLTSRLPLPIDVKHAWLKNNNLRFLFTQFVPLPKYTIHEHVAGFLNSQAAVGLTQHVTFHKQELRKCVPSLCPLCLSQMSTLVVVRQVFKN
jgi:hypothetical protein